MRYALALLLFAGCGARQATTPDAAPATVVAEPSSDDGPGPGEVIACFPLGFDTFGNEPLVERVVALLTGRFDSSAQAAIVPDYFDIHLAICPISAPSLGKHVLYVEQARADKLTEPYRQRLYVVEGGQQGEVVSRVFEFTDPAPFTGFCDRAEADRPAYADGLAAEKVGCAVHLREMTYNSDEQRGGERSMGFGGGTEGDGCPSSLRGATHATSVVILNAAGMQSWDQGFDAAGTQVWGATAGPYQFLRTGLPKDP
jgi:hypothetical protein